jgi:transcriptional regulator with XRE-family HTH domain
MATEPIPFQQQFQILLETLRDSQGLAYSVSAIAQAVELSEQALLYLLDGRSEYPRLDTLRRLCRFLHISLDYFQCETEADCRAFLVQALAQQSNTLHAITVESEDISAGGQRNVLTILEWLRRARHSGKH